MPWPDGRPTPVPAALFPRPLGLPLFPDLFQYLIGGTPVLSLAVFVIQGAALNGAFYSHLRGGAHGTAARQDACLFHDGGHALLVQHGHQSLAHPKGLQGLLRIEGRIYPKGPGSSPEGFLVVGRVGPECMLDPVADLDQDAVWNVAGILGDKPHADTLGADEPHHLLHLFQQHLGCITEEKVGLVKGDGQLGLVQISRLGKHFVQFGEHPQQECGVQQGGCRNSS